jgi:hypothetical protein
VAEGDVEVGKVFGLQAKIVPVTSAGRWRGRHTVQLSNWGNAPAKLRIVASDPDAALGFYLRPDVVELPLGGTATVRVSVRTRKPFLRGNPVRLPFQIVAERADAGPAAAPAPSYSDPSRPVVDGALNQKPILSRGVVALLSLILVAGIGLGAYAVVRDRPVAGGLGGAGLPDKPVVNVEVKGPDAVVVSWEAIPGVEGYRLYSVDPKKTEITLEQRDVPGGQTGLPVAGLQPLTEYCYQVSAVGGGGKEGPRSDLACKATAKGPPPSASPTPTPPVATPPNGGSPTTGGSPTVDPPPTQTEIPPGGSSPPPVPPGTVPPGSVPPVDGPYTGGKWAAVPWIVVENPAAQPQIDARLAKLRDAQLPAQALLSTNYPNLRRDNGDTLASGRILVAVGPFDSREAAQAACPQVMATTADLQCLLYQPQP